MKAKRIFLITVIFLVSLTFFSCRKGKVEITEVAWSVQNCNLPYIVNFYLIADVGYGSTTYLWDFGDGETSNAENPMHVYNENGLYTVNLTVTNKETTKYETFVVDLRIENVQVSAFFEYFTDYNYYAPAEVKFNNLAHLAENTFWNFGDGLGSNEFEPIHIYETPGTYNPTISATCGGDTVRFNAPIQILPPPQDISIDEVIVSMPANYLSGTYELEYYYGGMNETPLGLPSVIATTFPIGWSIFENLFFFNGNYDDNYITFEIYDVYYPQNPVFAYSISSYELSRIHYPEELVYNNGNGFQITVYLSYQNKNAK